MFLSMGRMISGTDPLFAEAVIGDKIKFIGSRSNTPKQAYVRIGEEERFRKPLAEIADGYEAVRTDPRFLAELDSEMIQSAGHPSSLQFAARLSAHLGGARIYLKREDINTQPSHLLAAVLGQALLAKRMGKKKLVAFSPTCRSGVLHASIPSKPGLPPELSLDSIMRKEKVQEKETKGGENK